MQQIPNAVSFYRLLAGEKAEGTVWYDFFSRWFQSYLQTGQVKGTVSIDFGASPVSTVTATLAATGMKASNSVILVPVGSGGAVGFACSCTAGNGSFTATVHTVGGTTTGSHSFFYLAF